MAYRILVVDDEEDILALLRDLFTMKGYQVLTAATGEQALEQCSKAPDLILLDVNMPGMDGFTLCKKIRDFLSCPILFLTARVEDADKLKGFSAGGDDYILKPFSTAELLARVGAHLRREERRQGSSRLKFDGGLTIDYGQRQAFQDGKPVHLAKKEFDIVSCCPCTPPRVFEPGAHLRIGVGLGQRWGQRRGGGAHPAHPGEAHRRGVRRPHRDHLGSGVQMAQVTRKLPWHRRLSLRWALVFTTLLCALAGFLLLALETAV